ncbi:CLUMA_CG009527, isoform A [Clunio marinus]|uniref:CLUMA_CG009527, isoform A n=1 Tax=Clunio marinus TaxID=568069 RepID=A0A1J1I7E0_9DIPT|nr:CLUMA_CG009527, isoform A [Clunio marinus]
MNVLILGYVFKYFPAFDYISLLFDESKKGVVLEVKLYIQAFKHSAKYIGFGIFIQMKHVCRHSKC